jgi:deazaflavin-dependent oxidoreductase (nitroreductase family)
MARAVETMIPGTASPYGDRVRRALPVARRALWHFNRRLASPIFHVGLGWVFSVPFGGWIMLLRTTGRKSGLTREAGLCYAIVDGSVCVMAGFGPTTDWLRNLQIDPRVEVVMPSGSAFAGRADVVADDAEYVRAFRAVDRAMFGAVRVGTFVGRDPTDAAIAGVKAWFPIARITPTGIAPGPADPGGARHLLIDALLIAWLVRRTIRARRSA